MKKKEKKKVLLLITKSNWGGAQRYVHDLAIGLQKTNYNVVVALGGNGALISKLISTGIQVKQISALQRDISAFKEILSIWQISKIIMSEQPEILHVNSSKAGGLGALIGRILGVKTIIYTAHGWAFNEDRYPITKLVLKFLHWLTVLLSHKTILVSNMVLQQMNWIGVQKKMRLVHNGRIPPKYETKINARAELRKIFNCPHEVNDEIWTGTIAELHPVKRHDLMLDAVSILKKNGILFKHIIIGGGKEREHLKEKILKLNLKKNVFLVGHIDEAARLLTAFDIFVLPSKSEAFAYVIIEAAQAGLAIVASNVGGIPEIITHKKEGLLFQSGDIEALSAALLQLIQDDDFANTLSENAKKKSCLFTLDNMLKNTVSVYEE